MQTVEEKDELSSSESSLTSSCNSYVIKLQELGLMPEDEEGMKAVFRQLIVKGQISQEVEEESKSGDEAMEQSINE